MPFEKTLALIKPDAVAAGNEKDIEQLIEMHGFTIVAKKRIQLTRKRAEEFYGEHRGKEFFEGLVGFMTSGPIVALCLAKDDAIKAWRALMGPTNSLVAKEQSPKSLRAIFGTDGRQNATHGSDSTASAFREIKFFFPEVTVDPLPPRDQARAYLMDKLNPTLTKGLTALASARPTSNPYQAILWLSDWLLHNNPNKPKVMSREEFPIDPALEADDSVFADALKARMAAGGGVNGSAGQSGRDGAAALLPLVPLQDGADSEVVLAPQPGPTAVELPPEVPAPEAAAAEEEEETPAPREEEAVAPGAAGGEEEADPAELEAAAERIQALYRGHVARKSVEEIRGEQEAAGVPEPTEDEGGAVEEVQGGGPVPAEGVEAALEEEGGLQEAAEAPTEEEAPQDE